MLRTISYLRGKITGFLSSMTIKVYFNAEIKKRWEFVRDKHNRDQVVLFSKQDTKRILLRTKLAKYEASA